MQDIQDRPVARGFGRFGRTALTKERSTFKKIRSTFQNKRSTVITTPYRGVGIGPADLAAARLEHRLYGVSPTIKISCD